MAKGKYAAKAANRLARLDNEIIAEQVAEIDQLKTKISELEQRLHAERTERQSSILARAEELSQGAVAEANRRLTVAERRLVEDREWMAEWLVDNWLRESPPLDAFTRLVGESRAAEYFSRMGSRVDRADIHLPRRVRRRALNAGELMSADNLTEASISHLSAGGK